MSEHEEVLEQLQSVVGDLSPMLQELLAPVTEPIIEAINEQTDVLKEIRDEMLKIKHPMMILHPPENMKLQAIYVAKQEDGETVQQEDPDS